MRNDSNWKMTKCDKTEKSGTVQFFTDSYLFSKLSSRKLLMTPVLPVLVRILSSQLHMLRVSRQSEMHSTGWKLSSWEFVWPDAVYSGVSWNSWRCIWVKSKDCFVSWPIPQRRTHQLAWKWWNDWTRWKLLWDFKAVEKENDDTRDLRWCCFPSTGLSLPSSWCVVIPAFRESAESKTLGYTVFRSKNRTISEPMYLFYYSDSDFHSPHYQSVRPTTEHNILYNLLGTSSVNLTTSTLEGPVMQSTRVSSPHRREVSSLYLPDGSEVSSQNVMFVNR